MSSKRRFLFAGAAVLVLAAIVAGGAFFFYFRFVSLPGEATAKFIPSDAPVYLSVNLRPGIGQIRSARDFLGVLQTEGFLERRDLILDDLEKEFGFHPIDNVSPWLGTSISFALLNPDPDAPEWVLLAHSRDRDTAIDFADTLVKSLQYNRGPEMRFTDTMTDTLVESLADNQGYDSRSYRGAQLWEHTHDDKPAVGVTEEYLLIASSAATIEEMVGNLLAPPSTSLAKNADFMAARESLATARVVFLYVRAREVLDVLGLGYGPILGSIGPDQVTSNVLGNTPEFIAASASFVDLGFRVDFVAETPPEALVMDPSDRLESAKALPANTLVLLSTLEFPEKWKRLRESLDGDGSEGFDILMGTFLEFTGIDVEIDLIDPLSGEVALALLPSDISIGTISGQLLSGPIQALLLLGVEDPQKIGQTLDKIARKLEEDGLQTDRPALGDWEAVTWDLDDAGGPLSDYRPGYVVTDEWAVIGSTFEGLEDFHGAISGNADRLESDPEFSRLGKMTPNPALGLTYFNLAGIFEMIEGALTDDALSSYQEEVLPLVEHLSAFLGAGSVTEEEVRITFVLSLRE